MKNLWKTISMIICVCGLILTLGGCGGNTSSSSSGTNAPAKQETMQQQALKDKSVSDEYRNALKKGINYAQTMHMSKAGVYHQLTSEYGEKFPEDAAQWAVAHMSDIDWKANALAKAKSYRKLQNMSTARIHDQLVSEYGEKFTEEEAQYAMNHLDDK